MLRCFPFTMPRHIVSLGEGMTPLLKADRLGRALGASDLWVKDEGIEPHRLLQGARPVVRHLDVRGTGLVQSRHRVRRQCRQRAGSLRRRGWN